MPRSAIIWTRSRELSLNARYHLMHKTIISWSKCRPLKRSCAEMGSVICGHYRPAPTFSSVCTRTLIDWDLGTLVIAKALDFYDDFCSHRATSLKADGKDILSVRMLLNSGEDTETV